MKDKDTVNISELMNLNKTISKAVRKDIRDFNTIETTNTIEQNKSLKVLKRKLNTGTRNIYKLKNKQGHAVYEQQEIIKIIEEYYSTLYRRDALTPDEEITAIQNQESEELPDITEKEIESALKGMKNSKSPGEDGIVSQMLKLGGECVIQALKTLYNAGLFEGVTPEKWNGSLTGLGRLNSHMNKTRLIESANYAFYQAAEETAEHVLCNCPGLDRIRLNTFEYNKPYDFISVT
ncbi:uncharacterized protein [Diabrotica undecimpunctata]|uniref:uncharacterized protein n=1 Tax=Diabrotica undecimpunctata TaxID=50387 RepID=UPI003B639508